MALLYYFQAILGTTLFHAILPVFDFVGAYWFSIAHPLSRIPVFFMGVCAGVICVRIQEQDFDAMNCKYFVIFQSMFNYSTSHLIVTCAADLCMSYLPFSRFWSIEQQCDTFIY